MNFFRTVFALCSGTSVFMRLLNVSLFRAVFHTAFLIFLCSLFVSVCAFLLNGGKIREVTDRLFEEVGSITLDQYGIQTEKTPEQKKSFILSAVLRLDYFPNETFTLKDMDSWHSPMGIVCTNAGIAYWFKDPYKNDRYTVSVAMDLNRLKGLDSDTAITSVFWTVKNPSVFRQDVDRNEMEKFLSSALTSPKGEVFKIPESLYFSLSSPESVSSFILMMLGLGGFIGTFLQMLFFLLLAGVFFAFAQYMRISSLPKKLPFKTVFALILYSAFPPMVIGALYTGFELPLLSYQIIFFVSFFIYHMVAFNTVLRNLNPPPPEPDDNSDF